MTREPTGAAIQRESSAQPRPSRRVRFVVLAMLGILLLALMASQCWVLTGRHYTVEEGHLYRSAAQSHADLVAFCRKKGIRLVVDFRKNKELAHAEAETLAHAGIRHIHLPTTQNPPQDDVMRFLDIMDAAREQPVLIHCTHGVGRTGVFAAVYRMEYQGWSPRRAWLEAMMLAGFGSFLPGSEKARRILSYKPRAAARPTGVRP
jgi:protein tyrosine/serine phosphatase